MRHLLFDARDRYGSFPLILSVGAPRPSYAGLRLLILGVYPDRQAAEIALLEGAEAEPRMGTTNAPRRSSDCAGCERGWLPLVSVLESRRRCWMLTHTQGFPSPAALADHFQKHGVGVGAVTVQDYETRADAFMGEPLPPGTQEGVRQDQTRVRFNPATNEFGVMLATGHVLTYFIPDPAKHGLATNADYFQQECSK